MTTADRETQRQRRIMHEQLCRLCQEASIPIKAANIPFCIDVLNELDDLELSIEQGLILGSYLLGAARAAMATVATGN